MNDALRVVSSETSSPVIATGGEGRLPDERASGALTERGLRAAVSEANGTYHGPSHVRVPDLPSFLHPPAGEPPAMLSF